MGLDKNSINPMTGKSWATNPNTGVHDDNYFAQVVEPQYKQSHPDYAQNAIDTATKLRDFNIQSNQPAIQSYEQSKTPLQDRYKNLLDTIKGNQQVAENRQTTTTNNELGRRGISSDSGVYQQAMTNSLNPITSDYTHQYQGALANQNVDLSAIDRAIAQLKAGDPSNAVSGALNIGNQEQQASQYQQEFGLKQALQNFQMQQAIQPQQKNQYTTLGEGQTLFDLLGGNPVYTAPKTYKPTGSGSGNNLPDLNSIF